MYERPDPRPADPSEDREEDKYLQQVKIEKERARIRREGQREAEEEEAAQRRIVAVPASSYEIRRTRWLWRDRIPMGGLSLIAGKGDVSKSTLLAQFCGWLTTGDMKGEFYGTPQNVLYVVNEDSIQETVLPRLIAHGADIDRVFFLRVKSPIGEDAVMLPRDEDLLRREIQFRNAVATFIDPLSANVTGRKNDQGDMRSTYQRVNGIAESTRTAITGLAHTRKAGASDVLEAILGSSEQGNVARSVHGIVVDDKEDDARILSCEKLNVGQRHLLKSLRFTVHSEDIACTNGEWTRAPRIEWLEETTDTASDILDDRLNGHSGADDAARVILQYVMNNGGEVFAQDVIALPQLKKCSQTMLTRARKIAGIKSRRESASPPRAIWYLPS